MANKQINHHRRILGRERIAKFDLTPGMFVEFYYNKPNVTDNKPLVIILGLDTKSKLIHCININYLYEKDIQNLFNNISKKINLQFDNNYEKTKTNVKLETARINFTKKVDGHKLYESVIKPILFTKVRTKNCYRTYKFSKIQNLNLISYKLDVIEAQVRKDAKISKYALKSAELFKQLTEQGAVVETDNLRVDTQNIIKAKK
jgi:hypothetical protein